MFDDITDQGAHKSDNSLYNNNRQVGSMLLRCAQEAQGLSGRSIRKLPLQAYTFHMLSESSHGESTSLEAFLEALCLAIRNDVEARAGL
jgi:hypothetical protein